jgi:hypothetical protein
VEPYAAGLLREERGNFARDAASQALEIATVAVGLPKRLDAVLTRLNEGAVEVADPRVERQLARLVRLGQRGVAALVFSALLLAGALVRAADSGLGNVLMILSVLPLLFVLKPPRP